MELEDLRMMTERIPENKIEYDLTALDAYCKKNGVLPTDLLPKELKMFERPRKEK